ncbi:MAG TPA: hypothetical protein VGJ37_09940 [Pyrinomonadaceae bacterium]|jgi:hypothetical protein
MPFKESNTLDPKPSVRIFFIGLNILKLTDSDAGVDTAVQAFVHNSSQVHKLTIETRRKRPGKPDLLMMRHTGPLSLTVADGTRNHGFMILTNIEAADRGVTAYNGKEPSDEGTKLDDSFSLATLLGKPAGDVDPFGGLPSVFIDHGVFYTADKVTTKAQIVRKNGDKEDLTEVPTIIGANIYLDPSKPDQTVTLFWRQEGEDVFLPLKHSPNFTYEIYVINEPLFEPDSPLPRHGEFTEYFKILPDVSEGDKFEIEFLEEIPDRGSTRAPCMSLFLP